MNILVCVKRVPATGGRITLTADGQDIDTRYLGFTVSPHEECAVEEAVRIVEAQGGSSTRPDPRPGGRGRPAPRRDGDRDRAGGPARDRRPRLGPDRPRQARSSTRSGPLEAEGETFDLLLFGNEAADTGDFQVGIRVATALGRPCRHRHQGASRSADGRVSRPARGRGGGWEVFELPLPAVLAVKEGLNLPRYPSVPGRLRAKKKEIVRMTPQPRARRPDEGAPAAAGRADESTVEVIGQGAGAAPAVVELLTRLGVLGR